MQETQIRSGDSCHGPEKKEAHQEGEEKGRAPGRGDAQHGRGQGHPPPGK